MPRSLKRMIIDAALIYSAYVAYLGSIAFIVNGWMRYAALLIVALMLFVIWIGVWIGIRK